MRFSTSVSLLILSAAAAPSLVIAAPTSSSVQSVYAREDYTGPLLTRDPEPSGHNFGAGFNHGIYRRAAQELDRRAAEQLKRRSDDKAESSSSRDYSLGAVSKHDIYPRATQESNSRSTEQLKRRSGQAKRSNSKDHYFGAGFEHGIYRRAARELGRRSAEQLKRRSDEKTERSSSGGYSFGAGFEHGIYRRAAQELARRATPTSQTPSKIGEDESGASIFSTLFSGLGALFNGASALHSAKGKRELHEQLHQHLVRELEARGVPAEESGAFLFPLILSALPAIGKIASGLFSKIKKREFEDMLIAREDPDSEALQVLVDYINQHVTRSLNELD